MSRIRRAACGLSTWAAAFAARPRLRLLAGNAAVGIGYWSLAEVGSATQYTGQVQVAWLPVGFAAAMLYLGDLRWFAGGAVADLLLGTGVIPFHYQVIANPVTFGETTGNTIEFVLAACLMRRWLRPRNPLERPRDVAALLLALAIPVAVSAVIGTSSAWLGGQIPLTGTWSVARTWWLGDMSGGLLVAPLMLVWRQAPRPWRGLSRRQAGGAAAALSLVAAVSVLAFSSPYPLTYVVFPVLMLAAVNLGQRGATLALLLATGVAVAMTAARAGPFVQQSITNEVLNIQLYVLVASLTTLTLGAAVSARHRAAAELAGARQREADRAVRERQRIARDLHDSVSQTLFSLRLHAGIARHEAAVAELSPGSALPVAIEDMSGLAQAALLEMRASIFDLRGGAVAEQGLVTALQAHAAALAVRHDVTVTVTGPDERLMLSPETEELLFRIGQEAVTNAVKHSGCPAVSAEVTSTGGWVSLVIRDEGAGFDPARSYAGHLGLELMRARAGDAGGTAIIDSVPGAGTTVRVRIPAASPPAASLPAASGPAAAAPPAARVRPAEPPASVM